MGVYIKGMEIPECCGYCPFEYKNYCMAKHLTDRVIRLKIITHCVYEKYREARI